MDAKITFSGGEPTINFDDLDRNNKANKEALTKLFTAMGDNFIIQGVTGTTDITAGYVFLDGEILQVDAHTKTGSYFKKVVTYDVGGNKTFNDGTPRQTWQKNRATITAGSGSFFYDGNTDRLYDGLANVLNDGSAIIKGEAIKVANQSTIGASRFGTEAEVKAGSASTLMVSPDTLFAVTGGLLTKVVEIGDWNMDTTSVVQIATGIDIRKIRASSVIIRDDSNSTHYDLVTYSATGALGGGVTFNYPANEASVYRVSGGRFDSTLFDSTSYNRGWVTLSYIP